MTATMTTAQIAELRAGYAAIKTIDPCQPAYGKICAKLDAMPDTMLAQVAKAEIKFLSAMAVNRCVRRGVAL